MQLAMFRAMKMSQVMYTAPENSVFIENKIIRPIVWMIEYKQKNLKQSKFVVKAALPSQLTSSTQLMSSIDEMNGALKDASVLLSEIPISASLRAIQSLAPSPQNPTVTSNPLK